jgi:hypothetical protein
LESFANEISAGCEAVPLNAENAQIRGEKNRGKGYSAAIRLICGSLLIPGGWTTRRGSVFALL